MIDGKMECLGMLREEERKKFLARGNTGIPAAVSTLNTVFNPIFLFCVTQNLTSRYVIAFLSLLAL